MKSRRRHPGTGSEPSGRAEVELFTFWERDVTGEPLAPVAPPADEPEPSVAPLWWAAGLALAFLLVALLL
jgi:hypothetical protein